MRIWSADTKHKGALRKSELRRVSKLQTPEIQFSPCVWVTGSTVSPGPFALIFHSSGIGFHLETWCILNSSCQTDCTGWNRVWSLKSKLRFPALVALRFHSCSIFATTVGHNGVFSALYIYSNIWFLAFQAACAFLFSESAVRPTWRVGCQQATCCIQRGGWGAVLSSKASRQLDVARSGVCDLSFSWVSRVSTTIRTTTYKVESCNFTIQCLVGLLFLACISIRWPPSSFSSESETFWVLEKDFRFLSWFRDS